MRIFHSSREAKEFLISRIIEEAARENVPLSEVERKMLYFSETDWTLPDMTEVYKEFDREYEQDAYEKKIAGLIAQAAQHDRLESRDQHDAWLKAIRLLRKEDHYILVMIDSAMTNPYGFTDGSPLRPRFDQLNLFISGLAIAAVVVASVFLNDFFSARYGIHLGRYLPSENTVIAVVVLAVLGAYLVLRLTVGRNEAGKLLFKLWSRILGPKRL